MAGDSINACESPATIHARSGKITSFMECRSDIRIQSLRHMIEVMGSTLEIITKFNRGEVRITNYTDIAGFWDSEG